MLGAAAQNFVWATAESAVSLFVCSNADLLVLNTHVVLVDTMLAVED